MNALLQLNSFGCSKTEAYQLGVQRRQMFLESISRSVKLNGPTKYPHAYVYSLPGLGKTFTITKYLNDNQVEFYSVSGNISMFAFGIQLAVINFLSQKIKRVIVFVDDCDTLFSTEENCNTMKQVLHGIKKFIYSKSLQSQIQSLPELHRQAVEFHQELDKPGFTIDCGKMTFIFTSNFKLPDDDKVSELIQKGGRSSILAIHKNAIRSRCKVVDCDLTPAEQWGWISDVVFNTDCLLDYNLSKDDKISIMDFQWDNWERLKERSIRVVEKMAETKMLNKKHYNLEWECDYLK